ncbi:MAG: cytochrome c [Phyllobacteriaceae bacterium]|nr:cytochrome c [Phyllobacteriaceae bacterium]
MRRVALTLGCLTTLLLPSVAAHAAVDVTAGKRLYVDNCRRCHGARAQGGIGKKLAGDAAYWDFDVFKRTVLTGIDDEGRTMKTEMPRWGTTGFAKPAGVKPSDDDLRNIQAYLRTFGRKRTSAN